ncbi:NB-ARC domains-containing protein [Artemisia annua]|uniref:NB-ARC domains-containing protein n=1 Tax=Artemisia annua TaxID=35608 RepID=A0A2U1PZ15_ARTAN|nr:NB-ARC domains-containing protein [Artemisia annua]
MAEHFVCPVFYDVDPTEVRDQSGAVGEAFAIHNNKEEAGKWRDALKEASDLIGWEFMKTANGLVGMESRIDGFMSLLENILDDVRMIGIKGMGGIGKTTLARAVFRRLAFQFEGASFVDDVREVSRKSGLKKLQKQILSDVFNDEGANVSNVGEWKSMMKRRMCSRKILLVLDDVDQIEQLEALADQPNWFKAGSIIIITTRDEQLLIRHGVNIIHDVKLLSDSEASCLFSRLAFKKDTPVQGYEKHALEVVHYAAGLPLTIEVMGSTLSYREKNIWSSEIKLLKKFPLQQISEKLELSYKSLEDEYKEIFLDVACLLKGCDKERVVRMLESCGFSARIGLRVLEEKSMIITTKTFQGEFIDMHRQIEEMVKHIVRRAHPTISRHSRLWNQKEIEHILAKDLATKATKAIAVDSLVNLSSEIVTKGFGSFQNLTSLCLISEIDDDCVVKNDKIGMIFPNALKFLSWVLYKLRYIDLNHSRLRSLDLGLTSNLELLYLVECHNFKELHMPIECPKLTSLELSCSKLSTFDLRLTPNLEKLRLEQCHDLVELHMPIECLKLVSVNLSHSKLRTLDLGLTPNLEIKLRILPGSICSLRNLRNLKLYGCSLEELPEDIGRLECLEKLNLSFTSIKHLPDSICMLKNLKTLNLSSCWNLEKLPEDIGRLECLHNLILKECTQLIGVPDNICMLKELKYLSFLDCIQLQKLPEGLGDLQRLEELNIEGTRIRFLPPSISLLTELKIRGPQSGIRGIKDSFQLMALAGEPNWFKLEVDLSLQQETNRVLGLALYGKEKVQWIDQLKRLKNTPMREPLERLELSFSCLEYDYKDIFLDVACFLIGKRKDDAIRTLESCGFSAISGLDDLELKSLITVSDDQHLGMHGLIQDMGRFIVRRGYPDDPVKHTRLWEREKVEEILANGLDNVETSAIALDDHGSDIFANGFGNIKRLRFLRMVSKNDENTYHINQNFPYKLQYLSLEFYPYWSLPCEHVILHVTSRTRQTPRTKRVHSKLNNRLAVNLVR